MHETWVSSLRRPCTYELHTKVVGADQVKKEIKRKGDKTKKQSFGIYFKLQHTLIYMYYNEFSKIMCLT